jgi:putative membrane protein
MLLRWSLAVIHLLALGIGLGAVWARSRALGQPLDRDGFRRVLAADAWWGIAAILWIGSGLWRLFGQTEKATGYYMDNHLFWAKMALLLGILILEIMPMVGFIQWRRQLAAGIAPDTSRAGLYRRIGFIEALFVVLMVIAATGMARGIG